MSCLLHCVSHSLENNSEYLAFRHWRIINYPDKGSIFNKGQGKKLLVRFKGFLNLSRTMKFIPDFCHRLSIVPVRDTIYGLRQICLIFPVLFFYLSRTFQCLSRSETNLSWISSALFLSRTFQMSR